jgi:hypothetical protein
MQRIKKGAKKISMGAVKACLFALLSLVLYSVLAFALSGCQKIVTVEKPVPYYVPQECALSLPMRPAKEGDVVTDVKNIAKFAELSEAAALNCGVKQ